MMNAIKFAEYTAAASAGTSSKRSLDRFMLLTAERSTPRMPLVFWPNVPSLRSSATRTAMTIVAYKLVASESPKYGVLNVMKCCGTLPGVFVLATSTWPTILMIASTATIRVNVEILNSCQSNVPVPAIVMRMGMTVTAHLRFHAT